MKWKWAVASIVKKLYMKSRIRPSSLLNVPTLPTNKNAPMNCYKRNCKQHAGKRDQDADGEAHGHRLSSYSILANTLYSPCRRNEWKLPCPQDPGSLKTVTTPKPQSINCVDCKWPWREARSIRDVNWKGKVHYTGCPCYGVKLHLSWAVILSSRLSRSLSFATLELDPSRNKWKLLRTSSINSLELFHFSFLSAFCSGPFSVIKIPCTSMWNHCNVLELLQRPARRDYVSDYVVNWIITFHVLCGNEHEHWELLKWVTVLGVPLARLVSSEIAFILCTVMQNEG